MKKSSAAEAYRLDGIYGPLLEPIFHQLFGHMNIPGLYKESAASLSEKGHIVYALHSRSSIDTLLLNYRLKQDNLPAPELIFGKRFPLLEPASTLPATIRSFFSPAGSEARHRQYIEYMQRGHSASLIFLDRKPEDEGQDPILLLLRMQKEMEKPIYILPQRLIYSRSPIKVRNAARGEKTQLRPAKKLLTLLKKEELGFIEHGEPINLMEVVKHTQGWSKFIEETAREIRRELLFRLSSLGSNLSGAPFRSRDFVIQKTIKDPVLQTFMRSHSNDNAVPYEKVVKNAKKILDQVAADMQPSTINFFSVVLTWIFNNIYDGMDVDQEGLKMVRDVARKGSIIYVPCHKSHIDYLVLSYCLFHNWMSVPLIAAGINLAFFPMGWLLRRGGAFFMRRTFKSDPLYAQTFSAYVRTILGERIPMEFFIEGTRSRSGKLMLPKKGLLSMIVQGWESGITRDVHFVPVYVGYDTVVEEGAYIREMRGAEKKKENFWQLLKAGRILRNRYGKVYVRFAQPISLNEFMRGKPNYSQMNEDDRHYLYDDLAGNLIDSIYKKTVATPFSVLSSVLISRTAALDENATRYFFRLYLKYLKETGYGIASSLNDEDNAFDDTIKQMVEKGLVMPDKVDAVDEADIYLIEADKRIHLEYYKNITLNCFVPASLIANVLLRYPDGIEEKQFVKEVQTLALILEKEFIMDMGSFQAAMRFMLKSGIIFRAEGQYTIGNNKKDHALMFAGLIENYLESYLAVAQNVKKLSRRNKKDILKIINRYAARMYKRGQITRAEALCMPTYKGALDTFKAKGLLDEQYAVINEDAMKRMEQEIEAYLED